MFDALVVGQLVFGHLQAAGERRSLDVTPR